MSHPSSEHRCSVIRYHIFFCCSDFLRLGAIAHNIKGIVQPFTQQWSLCYYTLLLLCTAYMRLSLDSTLYPFQLFGAAILHTKVLTSVQWNGKKAACFMTCTSISKNILCFQTRVTNWGLLLPQISGLKFPNKSLGNTCNERVPFVKFQRSGIRTVRSIHDR